MEGRNPSRITAIARSRSLLSSEGAIQSPEEQEAPRQSAFCLGASFSRAAVTAVSRATPRDQEAVNEPSQEPPVLTRISGVRQQRCVAVTDAAGLETLS
jgi:hypothetical protein